MVSKYQTSWFAFWLAICQSRTSLQFFIQFFFYRTKVVSLSQQIPFLGSHGFGLEFKPHKVHIFELGIKFYIKSSPKH
jgi:hypothetical protein